MDKIEELYQKAMEEVSKEEKIKYEYNTWIVVPNVYEYKGGALFREPNPFGTKKAQENFFADADFFDLQSITEKGLDLEEQVTDYFNLIATNGLGKNMYRVLYCRKARIIEYIPDFLKKELWLE